MRGKRLRGSKRLSRGVPGLLHQVGDESGEIMVWLQPQTSERAEAFHGQIHWVGAKKGFKPIVDENLDSVALDHLYRLVEAFSPGRFHPTEEHASDSSILSKSSYVEAKLKVERLSRC